MSNKMRMSIINENEKNEIKEEEEKNSRHGPCSDKKRIFMAVNTTIQTDTMRT